MSVTNGRGAGIELSEGANLVMTGGSVTNTTQGAGIVGKLNTSIRLDGVTVSNNDATATSLYGGGVSAGNGLVTITNSTFTGNIAKVAGAVYASNLTVENSKFMGNEATDSSNGVGAVVIVSRGRLTNTLVAGNFATTGVAGVVALRNAVVDVYNLSLIHI